MSSVRIRQLGLAPYASVWQQMVAWTAARSAQTDDEFWIAEHPPVFTLGANADPNHILQAGSISIVKSDRGGQVTYHGPGQLLVYTLVDVWRKPLGPRGLVQAIERAIIELLKSYGIKAETIAGAPGVYVHGKKLAALGLRIRKQGSYHGLALNVDPDLTPFSQINPCGYPGLAPTSLSALGVHTNCEQVAPPLVYHLSRELGYDAVKPATEMAASQAGYPAHPDCTEIRNG